MIHRGISKQLALYLHRQNTKTKTAPMLVINCTLFQCRKRRHFIDCKVLLFVMNSMFSMYCCQKHVCACESVWTRTIHWCMQLCSFRVNVVREICAHLYTHEERISNHPLLFHVIPFVIPFTNCVFWWWKKSLPKFTFPFPLNSTALTLSNVRIYTRQMYCMKILIYIFYIQYRKFQAESFTF